MAVTLRLHLVIVVKHRLVEGQKGPLVEVLRSCHLDLKPSIWGTPSGLVNLELNGPQLVRPRRMSDTRSQLSPDYTDPALSSNRLRSKQYHQKYSFHPNWDLWVQQMLQTLSMKYKLTHQLKNNITTRIRCICTLIKPVLSLLSRGRSVGCY